jgi:hypothetical protein
MENDRSKTRKHKAARLFHYTIAHSYDLIRAEGMIKTTAVGTDLAERPAVWFSFAPMWEPTATKGFWNPETDEYHRATWDEMVGVLSPVRIEVVPDAAPYAWRDYVRLGGASMATIRALQESARGWGANPFQWRVSFDDVGREMWLRVEHWSGAEWAPFP